jgi:hypothetical protein
VERPVQSFTRIEGLLQAVNLPRIIAMQHDNHAGFFRVIALGQDLDLLVVHGNDWIFEFENF